MAKQLNILWDQCLEVLSDNMSNSAFQTWFKPLIPLSFNEQDELLVLQASSQFVVTYIEENYLDLLAQTLRRVFGPNVKLDYRIVVDSTSGTSVKSPSNISPLIDSALAGDLASSVAQQPLSKWDSQLNPSYTFNTFVIGEANKYARTSGLAVAQRPGNTAFNPLFIFGDSGVGKTHLANAIGNQVLQLYPDKKVIYVSANTFKLQYQEAAQHNHIPDFLRFYQQLDVLIVDDIQYFSGLTKTQDTFFHIFNYLQQSRKQLIMTSDRPPLELKDVEARLLTRFKWGLSVEMLQPDYQLRKDILLTKMKRDGIELSDEIVDFIATNVGDSVRDLEGVLASLLAYSTLSDKEIDMALAEKVVSRIVSLRPRVISMNEICDAVAEHYHLSARAIQSASRTSEVMQARHMMIYLTKILTEHSLNEIGLFLGRRTHATVLHSYNEFKGRLEVDPILRQQMQRIKSVIMH